MKCFLVLSLFFLSLSSAVAQNPKVVAEMASSLKVQALELSKEAWAFRKKNSKSYFFVNKKESNIKLHYRKYTFAPAKKALVILPGYATPEIKYLYSLYINKESLKSFDIYVLDMRSQGRSENTLKNEKLLVHINSINEYISDIKVFFEDVLPKYADGAVVMAHSMSGHVITRAIVDEPDLQAKIKKLILLAPGYQLNFDRFGFTGFWGELGVKIITAVVRPLMSLGIFKSNDFPPGVAPAYVNLEPRGIDGLSSIVANPIFPWFYYYMQVFEEREGDPDSRVIERVAPTLKWMFEMNDSWVYLNHLIPAGNLKKLTVPVKMFLAEDERTVDNNAARSLCKHINGCELKVIKGARHEIFFEAPALVADILANL